MSVASSNSMRHMSEAPSRLKPHSSYSSFLPNASLAYSMTLFIVMTPSVTRSTPSISAIGGTSLCSKLRLALSGLPRYLAAMDEVVPPQMMCLPLHQSAVLQDSGGYRLHNTRPKFCLMRNEILKPLVSSRQNGVV